MESKINIAELLKDCPQGMELDCTVYNNVTLEYVYELNSLPICVRIQNRGTIFLSKYGQLNDEPYCKCIIFPKGKTTWEGFQRPFKDGDVVFYSNTIAIFKEWGDETLFRTYCVFYPTVSNPTYQFEIGRPLFGKDIHREARLATEEEKEKLFKAIKDNGYKWNPETKTLEKLPKFKVGDRIQGYGTHINHPIRVVKSLEWDRYILDNGNYIKFGDEHAYKLLKFDITTLIPFESRVLVREDKTDVWQPTFYGFFNQKNKRFYTTSTTWLMCIPYNEDTKHLIGTANDCDEYYKT